jgi:hypothetical protein
LGGKKPLVEGLWARQRNHHDLEPVLFYRATLPLSSQALSYPAGVLRRHRVSISSIKRVSHP